MRNRAGDEVRRIREALEHEVDVDAEWQAFTASARQHSGRTAPVVDAPRPHQPRRRWMIAAAAATVVAGIAAIAMRDTRDQVQTVQPGTDTADRPTTTIAATTIGPSPATNTPSTVPLTQPPTTTSLRAGSASVSYLDPPPELALRRLATVVISDAPAATHSLVIGDLGVAVFAPRDDHPGVVHLVDFTGSVRTVDLPAAAGSVFAYGPGEILYATLPSDNFEDFAVGALSVTTAGTIETVATAPANWMRFIELPTGAYGHGEQGVQDRRYGERNAELAIRYADAAGNEIALEPAPTWFMLDPAGHAGGLGGVVTSSTGRSWTLEVEAAPDRAATYVESAPPAAGANGAGAYWTHIGPDAEPTDDFGTPTMWVLADLRADGTASWWSIPRGWEVAASDIWGTVLTRQTDNQLEIALVEL